MADTSNLPTSLVDLQSYLLWPSKVLPFKVRVSITPFELGPLSATRRTRIRTSQNDTIKKTDGAATVSSKIAVPFFVALYETIT